MLLATTPADITFAIELDRLINIFLLTGKKMTEKPMKT